MSIEIDYCLRQAHETGKHRDWGLSKYDERALLPLFALLVNDRLRERRITCHTVLGAPQEIEAQSRDYLGSPPSSA
jgi:hypothetical protein